MSKQAKRTVIDAALTIAAIVAVLTVGDVGGWWRGLCIGLVMGAYGSWRYHNGQCDAYRTFGEQLDGLTRTAREVAQMTVRR
jgi:hypothetical protein